VITTIEQNGAAPTKYHLANRNPLRQTASQLARQSQIFGARLMRRSLGFRCWNSFGVLMYHRVCPLPPAGGVPTWNVTPKRLEQQLEGLLERGFEPWRLSDMVSAARCGDRIGRNAFAVTFDDGYACLLEHALPILIRLNVPATIFLVTGYIDNLSIDYLRQEFDIRDPLFAFPYGIPKAGFCPPEFMTIARNAGARCAITAEERLIRNGAEPFGWGRMLAAQNDTGGTLAAKLSGWYRAWSQ
jgi:hypothetical protein